MTDPVTENPTQGQTELPYRSVQFGKIYDRLEPNKPIDISAFGGIFVEIDESNLGLERVTLDNLKKAWEGAKNQWTQQCKELHIQLDPFEVFKYYHIQRKAFEILGKPTTQEGERRRKQIAQDDHVKLSQMKGIAMCSEYAILSTYIAQKIGEPVHLVIGTAAVDIGEDKPWREAHAFSWNDNLQAIYDGSLVQDGNEYPALMIPKKPTTLNTLERGLDVETQRIGTEFVRTYGLEAGGWGVRLPPATPISLQEAAEIT